MSVNSLRSNAFPSFAVCRDDEGVSVRVTTSDPLTSRWRMHFQAFSCKRSGSMKIFRFFKVFIRCHFVWFRSHFSHVFMFLKFLLFLSFLNLTLFSFNINSFFILNSKRFKPIVKFLFTTAINSSHNRKINGCCSFFGNLDMRFFFQYVCEKKSPFVVELYRIVNSVCTTINPGTRGGGRFFFFLTANGAKYPRTV